MKGNHKRKSGYESPLAWMMWIILAVCSLLISTPTPASPASISGESSTIFRMGKTTDDKKLYPLYEYLRLSGENNVGKSGSISFNMGGWGRVDLGDKSSDQNPDGDLQYGYLSYRANKNNLLLNAGRQFVAEGVATERIDGLYLRSDLAAGFGAAAFVGSPVVTTPDFKGGDIIYGGRIAQGMAKYYSIGLSALRTDNSGTRLREEEGLDLWLHPFKQVDVVGRSSYNSVTSGWMEHAYNATYSPLESLRFSVHFSNINYKDYFYQVTTTALSLTNGLLDPNEKVTTLGGSVEFSPHKTLTLTVDYKNYDYDIAGQAKYYGGKATFSLAESFVAGVAVHRMDGENSRLRFDEYRVFASKKWGKADITADFFAVNYDSAINGIKSTYSVSGVLAYAVTDNLRLAADVNYMKDTNWDNAVTGLVKVTYAFDKKFGSEGGAKSEKNKTFLFLILMLLILGGVLYACAKTTTVAKEHPMEVKGLPNCASCHTDQWGALNHKASDFYSKHKFYGGQQKFACATCHQESFCADCHARKTEIKPSDKYKDSPERMLPHRGDYLSRHRIEGRIDPASCLKCHGRQNNERCKKCHR